MSGWEGKQGYRSGWFLLACGGLLCEFEGAGVACCGGECGVVETSLDGCFELAGQYTSYDTETKNTVNRAEMRGVGM
jgi:hypothetical protein